MRQDQPVPDLMILGRSVVVGPGQAAPAEWSSCERIRVDAISRALADDLGAAWRGRKAIVVELTAGLGLDDPVLPPAEAISGQQPWEWSAALDLVAERLHHGVWANSVDARDTSPHRSWRWAELACRLGAARDERGRRRGAPRRLPRRVRRRATRRRGFEFASAYRCSTGYRLSMGCSAPSVRTRRSAFSSRRTSSQP